MSGAIDMNVEFDDKQLRQLKADMAPQQFIDALRAAAEDLLLIADRAAKEATPVVTGHARRSLAVSRQGSNATIVSRELYAYYPYFRWLDRGEDSRGRRMLVRPGGYGIRKAAGDAAVAAAPVVLDRCGREIAERWSS